MTNEMVVVPGILGVSERIGTSIVAKLIEDDRLPYDFLFRLATIDDSSVREAAAVADIHAALGFGRPSPQAKEYLHGRLPDCVYVPNFGHLPTILSQLVSVDYHSVGGLMPCNELRYKQYDAMESTAYSIWALLIKNLDPQLHDRLQPVRIPGERRSAFNGRVNYRHFLSRVAIRDSAIRDIYNGHVLAKGIGQVRSEQLLTLLADNHPELME